MFGVPFTRKRANSGIVTSAICLQHETMQVLRRKRPNQ